MKGGKGGEGGREGGSEGGREGERERERETVPLLDAARPSSGWGSDQRRSHTIPVSPGSTFLFSFWISSNVVPGVGRPPMCVYIVCVCEREREGEREGEREREREIWCRVNMICKINN